MFEEFEEFEEFERFERFEKFEESRYTGMSNTPFEKFEEFCDIESFIFALLSSGFFCSPVCFLGLAISISRFFKIIVKFPSHFVRKK